MAASKTRKKTKVRKSSTAARAVARPEASPISKKVYVAGSPIHGHGLFARKRIPADFVISRLEGMPTYEDGIYVLWITDDLGLEVTNDVRFVNHSKDSNCMLTDVDLVTTRVIEVGEELFHDYGW
ncbi:MAG: SET domain-containing protein [Granulosicoccus sp.]